jgi:hypothetical protein
MHELENSQTNTIYFSSENSVDIAIVEPALTDEEFELDEGSSLVYGIIGLIIGGLFLFSNLYLGIGIILGSVWFIPSFKKMVRSKFKFINKKSGTLVVLALLSVGLIHSFASKQHSQNQASVAGVREETVVVEQNEKLILELRAKELKIQELQDKLKQLEK